MSNYEGCKSLYSLASIKAQKSNSVQVCDAHAAAHSCVSRDNNKKITTINAATVFLKDIPQCCIFKNNSTASRLVYSPQEIICP